jgi:hypothetical protein
MTDPLQAAWQSQPPLGHLTIDADLLLQEVRRNRLSFKSKILWRDVREIGAAVVLLPVWIYLGRLAPEFWAWYLAIPAILWIPAFMIFDRHRHRRPAPSPAQSLHDCLQHSLAEVEHQLYLLRNVFWWYILPFIPPLVAFIAQLAWSVRFTPGLATFIFLGFCGYIGLSFFLIYRLNQHAVHKSLEPRRAELLALLAGLKNEGVGVE